MYDGLSDIYSETSIHRERLLKWSLQAGGLHAQVTVEHVLMRNHIEGK